MKPNAASGGADASFDTRRIVLVGDSSGNVELMTEALSGYEVTPATSAADLNPVFAGAVAVDLVIVDARTVDEGVAALVESLADEEFPVLLLSEEPSPAVRRNAAATEGLTFREKPLRPTDLRMTVEDALSGR